MDIYAKISEISVNQIGVFLKCMELENYSKVAESLSYTPSMVSKTIKRMEERLGLILFTRRASRIKPTRAAMELEREWSVALRAIERGVNEAYGAQAGGLSPLHVGLIDDSDHAEELFLTRARAFDEDLSSILVEKADMHALPNMLKHKRYDVIITAFHERDQLDEGEYAWRLIEYTKLAVFIPKGHPLYDKESLDMLDFRPYSFSTMDPLTNTGFYNMFLAGCRAFGFEPHIGNTVLNASSMRFSLETGNNLVCGDSIICGWENDHIRKYEVDVPGITGLIVAWSKHNEDERIMRFVDAMCVPEF